MENLNLSEEIEKLVEQEGNPVGMNSGDCILWKAEHPNCAGCQYELGCGKSVRLMLTMMIPTMYEPTGYDDYAKMNNRIQKLTEGILKAKSIGELHRIPTQ